MTLSLVYVVACTQAQTTGEAPPDLEKLKRIALQPGKGTTGEKIAAVVAIRDAGGPRAVAALLDLLGKVEPDRVSEIVLESLQHLGGQEAMEGLARAADDPAVGSYAMRLLHSMVSAKDQAVCKDVLTAVTAKADSLPAGNLAGALEVFTKVGFKPAAPFAREMLAAKRHRRVRAAAARALGRVGTAEDTPRLWKVVETTAANLGVNKHALCSLGQLGDAGDAKRLLKMALAIGATAEPGSSEFGVKRAAVAARAAILLRDLPKEVGSLEVAGTRSVAGGVEIALNLPKDCRGVLVEVSQGTKSVARGLVQGKTVKLALPSGAYRVVLRPLQFLGAKHLHGAAAASLRYHLSALYYPQQVLAPGEAMVVGQVKPGPPFAEGAAVANATAAQAPDAYAHAAKKAGWPQTKSGPVVLKGILSFWPSKDDAQRGEGKCALSTFFARRGVKLYGDASYLHLSMGTSAEFASAYRAVKSGDEAIVVGQFCRAVGVLSPYAFVALDLWKTADGAADEDESGRPSATPKEGAARFVRDRAAWAPAALSGPTCAPPYGNLHTSAWSRRLAAPACQRGCGVETSASDRSFVVDPPAARHGGFVMDPVCACRYLSFEPAALAGVR